jgi:hypothetical protein
LSGACARSIKRAGTIGEAAQGAVGARRADHDRRHRTEQP